MFSSKKILSGIFFLSILFLIMGCSFAAENISESIDMGIPENYDDSCAQTLQPDSEEISNAPNNEILEENNNIVNFTSDVTSGFESIEVQFNDTSSGNITSWYWDFGDGYNDIVQNATHKYEKFGSYNVSLTTFYNDGTNYTLIKPNYINVFTGSVFVNPDFEEGYIGTSSWVVYGWPESYNAQIRKSLSGYNSAYSGTYFLKLNFPEYHQGGGKDPWYTYGTFGQIVNLDVIDNITFYAKTYTKNQKAFDDLGGNQRFNVTIGDVIVGTYELETWQTYKEYIIDTTPFNGTQIFKITFLGCLPEKAGTYSYYDAFTASYNGLTHADFTYTLDNISEDNNIALQFNSLSVGLITDLLWEFDDGTTSTELNPVHSFKSGSHTVKLTASNVNHTDTYSYDFVLEFPSINGQMYNTMQEAINNANDGDVIDVPADLSENININKNLTLNFNGNKLINSGSSPVIQVTGGAQATIKNITLENSNVISTDDESSLTITESNIADTNITLNAGNIALDSNEFNSSFITVVSANAIIANNNIANGGIKVNGGKSKINNNVLSGNDVAITQTEGETNITSNIITDNNIGVNVTNGTANINFNVIYSNTNVSLAYVGSVDASNNWFGVIQPSFSTTPSDEYVDVYAPNAEQPAWLVLTFNSKETQFYTTQNHTIIANLTTNCNGDDTSSLGVLPKFTLPVSTEVGEVSEVNVEDSMGEFILTTGKLPSDEVSFTIRGEEYTLDDVAIVAKIINTNLTIESVENGVVIVTLKDVDGNIISDANVTYTVNLGNQITDKTVDGKITISGLKGTVTIAADYAGISEYPYYNSTTASETFHFVYDGNINITIPESAKTTETPSITIQLPTDAQGTVNIFVDAKKINTTTITGTTTIPLNDLGAGEHVVEVKYGDDDIYLPAEKTGNLIVSKVTPTITATGSSVGENETATVSVSIDGATGIVLVEVAGNKYFAELETGSATVNVVGLKAGNYTANIKYSGDDKYAENTATADIKVSEVEDKSITELKAELAEAKENATQLLNNLIDANEKIENLTTQLNETQANATKLAEDLADANAKVENLTTKLNETQSNATKLAEDLADANSKVDGLTAELNETQSNATKLAEDLADANSKVDGLTSQLNETQVNATKLADELKDANQKAENLTTQLGEAQKQIQTLSAELISTTVVANNLNIKALTNGNIQVTLKANGTALANKTVNVIINGETYNGTTGEDGIAKIPVKFASAGTYYATVTFAGDDTYKSSISTSKVVVSKKATKITAPKKSFKAKVKTKKVKITLKSGSTVLKSKKITLKVNGKTYTAKTNSKGVATIKVTKLTKKGTFTYTVKFAGDKAYKAITKKGKMTIK